MAARKGARPARKRGGGEEAAKLLTLSQVAKAVGISMPTAQKYKKRYQGRIPSTGSGRRQRYPAAAIAVFRELKKESLGRRGRPRATRAAGDGPLSLAEVGRRTGISYPTLVRYLRLHGKAIPQVGRGRARRFPPEAVAVFDELRSGSRRGRRPRRAARLASPARRAAGVDGALAARIRRIERMQADLSRQLDDVVKLLKQPLEVTIRPQ